MSGIVIVDLGTGNLRSVSRAVAHVSGGNGGITGGVRISAEPPVIAAASHLILPGQGALGAWIDRLNAHAELRQAVLGRLRHGPVLGICLGLQALYAHSEENGGLPGLGLLKGTVRHFAAAHQQARADSGAGGADPAHSANPARAGNSKTPRLKIPHMGWNRVRHTRAHPLWHGIADGSRFYFVHSYFVHAAAPGEVAGECEYGATFTAAAARGNLFATQFHPEKSQQAGLRLLHNFVNWNGT